MSRSKAGSPHDPRGKERFHEERATKTVAGAQPDLEAGITAIRETVKTLKPRPGAADARCARRCALCRQGAQPQGAGGQLHADQGAFEPHPADGQPVSRDGNRGHQFGGGGAAARSAADQALPPAVQRAAARRQELSRSSCCAPTTPSRGSPSIAARARPRAITTGPSPAPGRSTRRSTPCRNCSCCAAAPTASSTIATAPACFTRSSAAALVCVGRIDEPRIREAGARGEGLPRRQVERGAAGSRKADGQGGRRPRFRDRRDPARPAARGDLHPGQAGDQRARRGRCRCLRAGRQGRAGGCAGLLHPRRAELGPPHLLSAQHGRAGKGRSAVRRAAAILRGSAAAAHHPRRSRLARTGA